MFAFTLVSGGCSLNAVRNFRIPRFVLLSAVVVGIGIFLHPIMGTPTGKFALRSLSVSASPSRVEFSNGTRDARPNESRINEFSYQRLLSQQ